MTDISNIDDLNLKFKQLFGPEAPTILDDLKTEESVSIDAAKSLQFDDLSSIDSNQTKMVKPTEAEDDVTNAHLLKIPTQ